MVGGGALVGYVDQECLGVHHKGATPGPEAAGVGDLPGWAAQQGGEGGKRAARDTLARAVY